jgi:hypothetical protein
MVGLVAAVIICIIFPLLNGAVFKGISIDLFKADGASRYVVTGLISFISPGMWLRYIKAISK